MTVPILSVVVQYEHDTVAARQRSRQIARLLGFDNQDQTRIATAVSEITRNAFRYAGGGKVEFVVEGATLPSSSSSASATADPAFRISKHPGGPLHLANRHGVGNPWSTPPRRPVRHPVRAAARAVVILKKVFPGASFLSKQDAVRLVDQINLRNRAIPSANSSSRIRNSWPSRPCAIARRTDSA